ncbi:hypothetical protein BJ742DRAFT_824166 [Cladochytrium replicatum]|nr:hypothetical protein BJ742DRAFT_824166 [Cladochytrium replicatum]
MTIKSEVPQRKLKVKVLGAGVQGLSAAIMLLDAGHQVAIYAKSSPNNLDDPLYTSPKAGANWQSSADPTDLRLQGWDEITLRRFFEILKSPKLAEEAGVIPMKGQGFMPEKPKDWVADWFGGRGVTPGYHEIEAAKLPVGCKFGVEYETVTVNTGKYLPWLMKTFLGMGGTFFQLSKPLAKLSELYHDDEGVDVVINCSGYGAKFLEDVKDDQVIPARGQIVIVKPVRKVARTASKVGARLGDPNAGEITYVIPRDNGEVILGGTYQLGNTNPNPDAQTAKEIMGRCLVLCPELLDPVTGGAPPPIVRHVVGFRPTRKGGVRMEAEVQLTKLGRPLLVVHNYGHGGYGFQSSWGCADHVASVVRSWTGQESLELRSVFSKL